MCRVRTMGAGRPRMPFARATSQESVELWVLITSHSLAAGCWRIQPIMEIRPLTFFRPIGNASTGTPNRAASSCMRASCGHSRRTLWPRRIKPADSVRIRISWPPQPSDDSVWIIDSGFMSVRHIASCTAWRRNRLQQAIRRADRIQRSARARAQGSCRHALLWKADGQSPASSVRA